MGHIDFLRALGIWTVGLCATMIVSYFIDPTGLFLSVEDNIISLVAAVPVLAALTYWYFSAPHCRPSLRAGVQLGAFMLVTSAVVGGVQMVTMPELMNMPEIPYQNTFMLACIALGLLVPGLTARWMAKR